MSKDSSDDVCPNPDDPEYVEYWSRYIHLKDQCMAKEKDLVERYGPNARLDQRQALESRINMLTNYLLPTDSVARVKFEVEWFEFVNQCLEVMHNDIIQMLKAQQAEANKKKLFVPGQGFQLP